MAEETIEATNATVLGTGTEAGELEGFEISPQQRRTWLLRRYQSALYTRVILEIEGELDVNALKQAADKVVARHEILRTCFQRVPGRSVPVQIIFDHLPPAWQESDATKRTSTEQSEAAQEFLADTSCNHFPYETGPLFRLSLLRLKADKSLLSLCLPSLCADSASLPILIRDLAAFYTGEEPNTGEEPLQYADLADWQNQFLENKADGEAGHAFWRQQDLNVPAVTLPFEKEGDSEAEFWLASISIPLDTTLAQQLQEAARQREHLPSAILAGCWQGLLWRLSGSQDVIVHHLAEGRTDQDLQNAVGPLARWLPIRVAIDANAPAARIWRRTNKAMTDASHWQYFWNWNAGSAEEELQQTSPEQIGFHYEPWQDHLTAGSISIKTLGHSSCLEPFKLTLKCLQRPEGLSLEFEFDPQRYREADIHRLAGYYQVLLEKALQNPDAPLASLPLLPAAEYQQVVVDFNRTETSFPAASSIHSLFEQQVQRTPDAIALICEEQQLTYQELNRCANQLAHFLREQGVGPDMPVGLCLERSLDLIVGMLGILKAGGAYLPLDPALPKERLAGMLEDSGARLLLTHSAFASLADSSVRTFCLDQEAPTFASYSQADPESGVQPEHLCYVIYTSGSTGRPKGVGIEHRHLLAYVQGVSHRLQLPAGAHYASVSTLSADLGNTMVFPSLCLGGHLHLIASERAMDPNGWREYLNRHPIDCLKIVPSHLSALLGNGKVEEELLPRQVLVLGGETSRWELVDRILDASPALRVFNHYGPTETTVGVLTYAVGESRGSEATGSATVPLGRPLPNSRAYLLNSSLQPVPVGVVGELYIGGAQVGRGYLNQAELTNERFLQDPFASEAGTRLYKSGDLCRWLPDGNIEFLGRVDHQVKIRGYRIELGEIESVLRAHPAIREAVVLVREDRPEEKRLVGYVVDQAGKIDQGELKTYLGARLPGYMIPSALVCLPRFPLTANGKVDRKALPAPEEIAEQTEYTGARTPLEEILVGIWEELLGRERISIHQSFFDLGGHSLLATQVISRVRETFQVDVPLRYLFDSPSIAAFAEAMLLEEETRSDIESMAEMLVSLSGLSEEELEKSLEALQAGADL